MSNNNKNNNNDPSNPEYWEALGIKPIIVNPNDSKDVEEKAKEISERIREASKEIKQNNQQD